MEMGQHRKAGLGHTGLDRGYAQYLRFSPLSSPLELIQKAIQD